MTTPTLRSFLAPLAALSLLILPGCGSSKTDNTPSNQVAFNDYESVVGWVPGATTVTNDRAHSGKYAVKVSPGSDFGMGYGLTLAKAFSHKPKKIRIEAWGYMTDANSTARLGMQLFDYTANTATFGDGIDYGSAIKSYGKWVQISKDITLPDNVNSAQELRVFLWRAAASTPAYLDDLRISEVQ